MTDRFGLRALIPQTTMDSQKLASFAAPVRPNHVEQQAVSDAFAYYKIAAGPGFGSMLLGAAKQFGGQAGQAAKQWGGNVARAATRANQAGGIAARGAQAAGSGPLGQMGQGALQTAKTFAGSRAGRQAIGAGIGAAAVGHHLLKKPEPQAQPQSMMYPPPYALR